MPDQQQQPEQEHSEAANYTALMDSLIFDYFAKDLNTNNNDGDDNQEDLVDDDVSDNRAEEAVREVEDEQGLDGKMSTCKLP